MAQVSEFHVFVASPSDLPEEREAVRRAAATVNEVMGRPFGLRLNVLGWELTQPSLGRPQSRINPLVDECHLFVGILNRRWGTATGTYSSGFEEEFFRVLERQEEDDAPGVGLFFKDVPPEALVDPGPELQRVLVFQRKIRDEHSALYKKFGTIEAFELAIHSFFIDFLSSRLRHLVSPSASATSSVGEGASNRRVAENVAELDEARRQLATVLDYWGGVLHGEHSEADQDTDRLLSFALMLSREDEVLPVHAANRLFHRREEITLSRGEYDLWLRTLASDAGSNFKSTDERVIPGWGLLSSSSLPDDLVELAQSAAGWTARGAMLMVAETKKRPSALYGPTSDDEQRARSTDRWSKLLQNSQTREVLLGMAWDLRDPADRDLLTTVKNGIAADTLAYQETSALIAAMEDDWDAFISYVASAGSVGDLSRPGTEHLRYEGLAFKHC